MDTTFLSWARDSIPPSYIPITWEDKLERTARDYGPPETSTKPEDWAKFEDYERSPEYLSATIF